MRKLPREQWLENRRIYARAYRAANLEKRRAIERRYQESHREQERVRGRKKYYSNKGRHAQLTAAYRKSHPEKKAQYARKRYAAKCNAPINDLTAKQWEDIKAAYKNACAYCGRKMKRLEQDHITPLSKGGSHTLSNIVPACRSCNSKKFTGPVLCQVQPLLL